MRRYPLPPRFLAFVATALVAVPAALAVAGPAAGVMIGFDAAAAVFLATCLPLLGRHDPAGIRARARRNDANRPALLVIATLASLAVLASVASELGTAGRPDAATLVLVVVTLALAWTFANTVYALHYAHLYYLPAGGGDAGGLDVPGTHEPAYGDFAYFAFTLGMTFQTSDVTVTTPAMRGVVLAHSLLAFVFNLGVVAFTVNVLGGG